MITSDAVASLRPRPFGPPLRGWAPRTDGIITGRPLGPPEHEEGNVGSTLRSSISGRRMGVGALQYRTVAQRHRLCYSETDA